MSKVMPHGWAVYRYRFQHITIIISVLSVQSVNQKGENHLSVEAWRGCETIQEMAAYTVYVVNVTEGLDVSGGAHDCVKA